MGFGHTFNRCCIRSSTSSCFQRVIRRLMPDVHWDFIGQDGQADDQYLWICKPFSTVVKRQGAVCPAGHRYSLRAAWLDEIAFIEETLRAIARRQRLRYKGPRTKFLASEDFSAAVIASVRNNGDVFLADSFLRLRGHGC
jgi:RNA polymerase subunit RPABC4/transcription elongation factor Spt4